jgi:hypothetical protein
MVLGHRLERFTLFLGCFPRLDKVSFISRMGANGADWWIVRLKYRIEY